MGKTDKGWALRIPTVTDLEKRDSRLKGCTETGKLGVYWIAVSLGDLEGDTFTRDTFRKLD